MIPYFYIDEIVLGPITLHFWGIMVALGFLVGMATAYWYAKKQNGPYELIFDYGYYVLVASLLGARLFHVFAYEPVYYLANPLEIFYVWQGGFSSFGGMIGAYLITLWFIKKHKISFWDIADFGVFGYALGMAIGRIGCSAIHDHPGIHTDFWLGIQYPDGVRHDLGFYLFLFNLFLFCILWFLRKKYAKTGVLFLTYLLLYGIGRFGLDFLRTYDDIHSDVRYFSLTPAQWFSLVFVGVAIWFFIKKPVQLAQSD